MAADDLYVVMYKILAYLYSCMKKGIQPAESMYSHNSNILNINYNYWESVMYELARHGYVDGVVFVDDMNGEHILAGCDARITLEGVDFLKENSRMKKALKFIQESKAAIPFI